MLPEPLAPIAAQALRLLADGPLTRPELAERLRVTKQTASSAVAELEQRRLVEAVAVHQGAAGRSALRYGLHGGAGWVAGIDLGPERLRVAAARLDGTVVAERAVRDDSRLPPDWTRQLEAAAHALDGLARDLTEAEGGLLGVGVAVGRPVPQVVDLIGEHADEADVRLLDALAPVAPAAVWTENDVNCAALAQLRYRPGFTADDVVHLQVGTGLGAAVVIGGRVVRGARGRAGEVRGLPGDGGRTAEQSLSAAALLAAAGLHPAPLGESLDRLEAAARSGDPAALAALDAEAEGVARAIASLVAAVDPEVVVLSGAVGRREAVRRRVVAACARLELPTPVVEDPLGDAAAVLGATWLASDRVLAALTASAR